MNASDFRPEVSEVDPESQVPKVRKGLAFLPNPLPPSLERNVTLGTIYDSLSAADRLLNRLDGKIEQTPHPAIVMAHLRKREAQQSSRIEHTHASLEAMVTAPEDAGLKDDEVSEVNRNYSMIRLAIESVLPVGRGLMLNMHRTLIVDARYCPGQFRTVQVFIGGTSNFASARFVPPPAVHVEASMQSWEESARASDGPISTWPYWVRLAMLHYQFEAIHPFSDGNGRIGRALINVAPVKDAILKHPICHISEWLAENRQEYYDRLLAVSTRGQWVEWIDFFCRALAGQAQLDLDRVDRLTTLYKQMKASSEQISATTSLQRSLDEVFRNGVISAKQLGARLSLPPATAHDHIKKLIAAGVLERSSSLPGLYFAPSIFAAIRGNASDR